MQLICNVPLAQKSEQDSLAAEYASAPDILKALWQRVEADRVARVAAVRGKRRPGEPLVIYVSEANPARFKYVNGKCVQE